MPTQLHNNENEVPVGHAHTNRLKRGLSSNPIGDPVRAEKRARGLGVGPNNGAVQTHKSAFGSSLNVSKTTTSSRRAVLGDVTNRVVSKSSTSAYLQQKKKVTSTSVHTHTHTHTQAHANINVKRARLGRDPIATTPVVHTFDSMELSSPLGVPILAELAPIKEDEDPAIHDIDSEDKHDETACWQYAEDMTNYFLETEKKRMPSASYMARQSDINSKMRAILVDWIVDVHSKYKLNAQTLHIAIHLIDRHLEKDLSVARPRLQLVGITALFVAAKYEEIYPPEADDFVRITDNAYTREEMFAMEIEILTSVGYRVTFPTAYQFMKRFVKASRTCDDRVEHFAHYVVDRTLQEYKMIKHAPSRIAAAAVYIARTQMNDTPAWNSTMTHHSSYDEASLMDCIEDIKQMLWNTQNGVGKNSKLTAVRRKFEKERYMGVSALPLLFDEAA